MKKKSAVKVAAVPPTPERTMSETAKAFVQARTKVYGVSPHNSPQRQARLLSWLEQRVKCATESLHDARREVSMVALNAKFWDSEGPVLSEKPTEEELTAHFGRVAASLLEVELRIHTAETWLEHIEQIRFDLKMGGDVSHTASMDEGCGRDSGCEPEADAAVTQ